MWFNKITLKSVRLCRCSLKSANRIAKAKSFVDNLLKVGHVLNVVIGELFGVASHIFNFLSESLLDVRILGQLVTGKSQSSSGCVISSDQDHNCSCYNDQLIKFMFFLGLVAQRSILKNMASLRTILTDND